MSEKLPTDELSDRAKKAMTTALKGKPATRAAVSKLSRHDFIIQKGVFTKTADELIMWAREHKIEIPMFPRRVANT